MAEEPPRPSGSTPPPEHSPWALAGLGMQFFLAIMVFVYAGNWMDRRFGTAPLFLLGGLFVGGGGTFYASYRRLMSPKAPRRKDNDESSPRT